jgi:hypothetical protein
MPFKPRVSNLARTLKSVKAAEQIVFLSLAMQAFGVQALSPSQVFDKVKDSVVVVKTLDANGKAIGQGSGVLLPSGKIGTNCHVVKNGASFLVGGGKQFASATLWGSDEDKDICLLEAVGITGEPAQLGQASRLKVGEPVYAVGAPRGLELSLSDGIVSQLRGGTPPFIQTTAAISPGSSGGGLFDAEGRLVGFTTLYIEGGQSLNFAMPVEWAGEIQQGSKVLQESNTKAAPKRSWVDWEIRTAALQAAKNWTGMRDWTLRWTKAQPEDSYAWSRLGDAFTELKRYPEAVDAYRESVRIDPADANARTILAIAYAQAGDRTAALEELRQLRRVDPAGANKLVKFLEKFALENVNAAKGWVIVGADKTDTQYVNPSTIRRKGNMVKMWDLIDLKKAKVVDKLIKPYMSMKHQFEYDCEEERMRVLSSSLHSGNMGKGNVVFSDSEPDQWRSIPPDSRGENMWSVACGKGR